MSATPKTEKPARIQALARASAIVDVVASGDPDGVSLAEVTGATDLNKTTAFNLLSSLITTRFVEQDVQTKKYRLGMRNLELGRIVQQRMHISRLAQPILANLCKKTNETVNLGLPDLEDLLVVDSYQGSRLLHATSYGRWRSFYHCTALGKAFLSGWDRSRRQTVYDLKGLPSQTSRTVTDIEQLEAQLAEFHRQGYALDIGENEVGVNGIATAIVDGLGEVTAAISVAGHSGRLTEEAMQEIAPHVVQAGQSISVAIGGSGDMPSAQS